MTTEPVSIPLRLLAERFQASGDERWLLSDRQKRNGEQQAGSVNNYVASAYMRCASELKRVLNGEIPPPVGVDWPEELE